MTFDNLFSPLRVGAISVPHRIFMAPMTRARSLEPGDVPAPVMAEYYRQRASAGLIITEATQVSFEAKGWAGAPGIHTPEQTAAWQNISKAIHADGGRVAVQVWHTGRVSHTSLQPGQQAPGAPSSIPTEGLVRLRDAVGRNYPTPASMPRELQTGEIKRIVGDFGRASRNAQAAQFDLLELHGAHGYLIHQFLSPSANQRTDAYGGSREKRMRFALEVADAAIANWSADRIGFRLYPRGPYSGIQDTEELAATSLQLMRELAKRQIAYLHLSEPDWVGGEPYSDAYRAEIRNAFPGVIVSAGAYTPEKAEALIARGLIDAVAFGRLFIANPDLVERIRVGAPFNEVRREGRYSDGATGYTDYPYFRAA